MVSLRSFLAIAALTASAAASPAPRVPLSPLNKRDTCEFPVLDSFPAPRCYEVGADASCQFCCVGGISLPAEYHCHFGHTGINCAEEGYDGYNLWHCDDH
ncbi:uncharacterized protein F5Z01DRAFT_674688 [Emericellopsis atlantica]|uniref:Uncharacterized protein n=1 Tax=Emericellopsis atlantica TaxID=2614577 RepID=A0A9P7ZLA9_9HYPO|nr:uncharacterized protein F5Z01DRAFT_674688 [Emericellopsis atlantica]KAG9253807.1 hypothetical protein F5Z01DRAFT_674688 [Emericellopsis atlantica]